MVEITLFFNFLDFSGRGEGAAAPLAVLLNTPLILAKMYLLNIETN